MSKLVVFDIDGTILDSFGFFERVIAHYSRENGLKIPSMAAINHHYDDPLNHDYDWGLSPEDQKRHLNNAFLLSDKWSMSGAPDKTPQLFAGVGDMLVHLKDLGHTLAIVTSKAEAPLDHLLDMHGVKKLFSAQRTWDDIRRRNEREKPYPDMLQSVIRELKFDPAETVMVGDTSMDMRMGKGANSHTIGVSWGSHPRHFLEAAGAHHILDDHVDEIVTTVKKIF